MDKILSLFDYFKEAYHLNRLNKKLYRPQIALILFKLIMVVIIGLRVYNWLDYIGLYNYSPHALLKLAVADGLMLLCLLLTYAVIAVIIESGLYNMYKACITTGSTSASDFWAGIQKYFLRLLLGNLLVILGYIVLSPLYLIAGLITLTIGFGALSILAGVFLTMWKISIVMSDNGIVAAIRDSFRFASRNLIPLTLLQLVHWAFVNGPTSGNSNVINFSNNANELSTIFNGGSYDPYYGAETAELAAKVIRIVVMVLIPVITIATLAASLIRMVFEVFFSLVLFIVYSRGFVAKADQQEEVLS